MTQLPPMLSYAQNGEDVVLRRAFADQETGFYVDVGACDPVEDSVTNHFYESGWRGINIEADAHWFDALRAARPRDVNIHAAVGRGGGMASFFPARIRGHGTLDPEVAARRDVEAPTPVQRMSLADIATAYARGRSIDFLKIDVEGWEAEVLASIDLREIRPRVILVEAVDQDGQETHAAWEPALLEADYRFALFDGLNRFYCREEEAELLLPRLAAPANVLDNFRLAREAREQAALASRLDEEQAAARDRMAQAEASARSEVERERVAAQEELAQAREAAQRALEEERSAARRKLAQERTLRDAAVAGERAALQERDQAQAEAVRLRHACEAAEQAEREARQSLEREAAAHQACRLHLETLHASTSWRVTEPLRNAKRLLKLCLPRRGRG